MGKKLWVELDCRKDYDHIEMSGKAANAGTVAPVLAAIAVTHIPVSGCLFAIIRVL